MAGPRRAPLRRFSYRRLTQRQTAFLVVVLALLVALRFWGPPGRPLPPESLEPGIYRLQRVVDGDTLLLGNGAAVRLIGADTPETVRPNHPVELWGPEATRFTRDFVAGGEIRLQFDGPRKDKYDRFLAYVWVDGRMLNEELIRAGLAVAKTHYRYSAATKARFREAESEARAAGRGLWSQQPPASGNL